MSNMESAAIPGSGLALNTGMDTARDILRREIEDLQKAMQDKEKEFSEQMARLREACNAKLEALAQLDRADSATTGQRVVTFRYANMRPNKAIRIYLEKVGTLKTISQLAKELIDGGCMFGKRQWRTEENIQRAVTKGAGLECIGDQIGLTEWFQQSGKYSHLKPDPKTPVRKR